MYCSFCETISVPDAEPPAVARGFHLCDVCGYFSHPQPFTSFYFAYLLVAFSYQYKTTTRCHACMRPEAWKMLLINSLFILGAPFALGQLLRAYFFGSHRAHYPKLDAANAAAQAGKVEKADVLYEQMLEEAPFRAGIQFNRAKSRAVATDWEGCLQAALNSLKECSNYRPAAELVGIALRAQGMTEEATVFEQHWGQEGLAIAEEGKTDHQE